MTPAEGKYLHRTAGPRIPAARLARPSRFGRMMPDDRGIATLDFDDEDQALAGAFAVERLEQAIPDQLRPF